MFLNVFTRWRKYIIPVLIELHWLPVKRRLEYKVTMHTFNALNEGSPAYICDLIDKHRPGRSLRSERTTSLRVPLTKTAIYGDRQFGKAAATLWTSLPTSLRDLTEPNKSRSALKTHWIFSLNGLIIVNCQLSMYIFNLLLMLAMCNNVLYFRF